MSFEINLQLFTLSHSKLELKLDWLTYFLYTYDIEKRSSIKSLITAVYVVDTTSLSYNSSNFSRPEKYSVSRLFSLKNNKLIGKIAIFIHQKLRLIWKICFQNHHYNCSKAHCGWKKGWIVEKISTYFSLGNFYSIFYALFTNSLVYQ